MTYTLTLIFLDGSTQELILSKPHTLAKEPVGALVYEDVEGASHNVMLSSLKEFFFHPTNYNLCAKWGQPTTDCTCDVCKAKMEKEKV